MVMTIMVMTMVMTIMMRARFFIRNHAVERSRRPQSHGSRRSVCASDEVYVLLL